ncbi:MAG: hypothetical protein KDC34_00970 [Saprospiraceae bacterium]|nr:hypothetical protein [Saprospiraceae bacterium]
MRISILFLLLFSLVACGTFKKTAELESPKPLLPFQATILPADTSSLWINHGNLDSDTVIINCQDGPTATLKFAAFGRSNLAFLPGYERYTSVYLHQAQTFNPSLYNYESDFSLDLAKLETEKSIAMLDLAIRYYKSRNKTVIVIGSTYGAMLIQDYLATHESLADKYILLAGRLDMDEEMILEYQHGNQGEFFEDGRSFIPDFEPTTIPPVTAADRESLLTNRLNAAVAFKRYTEALNHSDLSNVVYFYAENDQVVGSLSADEVKFLLTKGARVFPTKDGHADAFFRFIDAILDGRLVL